MCTVHVILMVMMTENIVRSPDPMLAIATPLVVMMLRHPFLIDTRSSLSNTIIPSP